MTLRRNLFKFHPKPERHIYYKTSKVLHDKQLRWNWKFPWIIQGNVLLTSLVNGHPFVLWKTIASIPRGGRKERSVSYSASFLTLGEKKYSTEISVKKKKKFWCSTHSPFSYPALQWKKILLSALHSHLIFIFYVL